MKFGFSEKPEIPKKESVEENLLIEEESFLSFEEWKELIKEDPVNNFFHFKDLNELESFSFEERMVLLGKACLDFRSTTSDLRHYFDVFESDLEEVLTIFSTNKLLPRSEGEKSMFALVYPILIENKLISEEPFQHFFNPRGGLGGTSYQQLSKGRNLAAAHLLENKKYSEKDDEIPEFTVFDSLLDEIDSGSFQRKKKIDFFPEKNIEEGEKGELLRSALAELQDRLLNVEVFDLFYTSNSIRRERHYMELKRDRYVKEFGEHMKEGNTNNTIHSILYGNPNLIDSYEEAGRMISALVGSRRKPKTHEAYVQVMSSILEEMRYSIENRDENIKVAADLWNKNRNPALFHFVSRVLRTNPELSSKLLLKAIQEEKEDKKPLTAMLFRLELSSVGITEEGVNFLGKKYDLQQFNLPGGEVMRGTAKGDAVILDKEGEIQATFQLDLETSSKELTPDIVEFVYESVFIGNKNETNEERAEREKMLEEFKKDYKNIVEEIKKETPGVYIPNLDSFKEQVWFVLYYRKASKEDKKRLIEYSDLYGEEGIRVFVSMGVDEKVGEDVLKMGELLPQHIMKELIQVFGQLEYQINHSDEVISKKFFENDRSVSPSYNILKRATQILKKFTQRVCSKEYEQMKDKEKKAFEESIFKEIQMIQTEAVVFTAIFQSAYEQGGVNFEEVRDFDFELLRSGELSKKDKEEMREGVRENYKEKSHVVLEGVEKAFEDDSNTWHVLRKWDEKKQDFEVVAFVRFSPQKDKPGHVYAGSFNVSLKGGKIGTVMYDQAMDQMAKSYIIDGVATIKNQITSDLYITEKGGFRIAGAYTDEIGRTFFNMERDDSQKGIYQCHNWSNEKIKEEAVGIEDLLLGKPIVVFKFDIDKGDEVVKKTEEMINNNYLGTRYLLEKESGVGYVVFELKPDDPSEVKKLEELNVA